MVWLTFFSSPLLVVCFSSSWRPDCCRLRRWLCQAIWHSYTRDVSYIFKIVLPASSKVQRWLSVSWLLGHGICRLVSATRPHIQSVERVVGIGFQPGLDSGKVMAPVHLSLLDYFWLSLPSSLLAVDLVCYPHSIETLKKKKVASFLVKAEEL